jgi:hypothetical protein
VRERGSIIGRGGGILAVDITTQWLGAVRWSLIGRMGVGGVQGDGVFEKVNALGPCRVTKSWQLVGQCNAVLFISRSLTSTKLSGTSYDLYEWGANFSVCPSYVLTD